MIPDTGLDLTEAGAKALREDAKQAAGEMGLSDDEAILAGEG